MRKALGSVGMTGASMAFVVLVVLVTVGSAVVSAAAAVLLALAERHARVRMLDRCFWTYSLQRGRITIFLRFTSL
jgi:hypothetical protein